MTQQVKGTVRLRPGERILVIALQGIGNTIFLVPLLERIAERFPGHPVDLLVRSAAAGDLLDDRRFVSDIHVLPSLRAQNLLRIGAMLSGLRRRRYGASLLAFPANHPFFNLVSFWCGARIRVSYNYPKNLRRLGFLNNRQVELRPVHDYQQNLNLAEGLGVEAGEAGEPRLWSSVIRRLPRRQRPVKEGVLIGVHPGSSRERAMVEKRWPAERFRALVETLAASVPRSRFLLFFGPDEEDLRRRFEDMEGPRIGLVFGRPLRETLGLMADTDLFVANDSGLMNLAAALGRPVLDIAGGPTDPVRTRPLSRGSVVVFSAIPCYPCRSLGNIGDRFRCLFPTRRCLEDIPVERVAALALLMLRKKT